MKNKFYIVFFTLIFAEFTAFGQETQIITHVDTLQSGEVIVTISDSQDNIIDKGLAKPGFSFQNDTVDLVFPTSTNTDKQSLYFAQQYFSTATIATEHVHTRTLTGSWDWISFPCMPRLGNNGYDSQTLLETIDPLKDYIELNTQYAGSNKQLSFNFPYWTTYDIPTLESTQGYKYYTDPAGNQSLVVTGVVLDPATPIQLSSSYENWIGYFLEHPLDPEDAFIGVWEKLTRISTHDWTMVKINGQWICASTITPIEFGDGLIVTVSEDCQLIWNYASEPAESFAYSPTEYYSYEEKAEYTPFYFEMDSTSGIQEIGLTVNDSCVGAAAIEPGDSIVEVNAYLAGFPSGVPIEVETWSGYKSAKLSPVKYSLVDPFTRKRICRKVYTGEQKAYYILSFKTGETTEENPVALLHPASPNPFGSSTMLGFVLNRQANVSLTVHDLQGTTVKTLLRGSYHEGLYDAAWTGTDASGKQAGNGIYIVRLTVDDKIITNEKVVLIK